MPHITIEYSANLEPRVDIKALVKAAHEAALSTGVFNTGGVRSRAERRDVFVVADGKPENAFVAVTARIAGGRDEATRTRVGKAVFDAVCRELQPVYDTTPISISMEVQELVEVGAFRKNNIHDRLKAQAKAGAAA
jgi:5-carboxymethyl-2-hydroxymuconate isomerase